MALFALSCLVVTRMALSLAEPSFAARKSSQAVEPHRCPPQGFRTQGDFDLKWYASGKWFVQQQAVTPYLPKEDFYCVTAQYTLLEEPSLPWGYDVIVRNYAQTRLGIPEGESKMPLCAKVIHASAGMLEVAPCFLPTNLAGPYWVIAYSKDEGWALVSGGPPSIISGSGCANDHSSVNGSGLWIFTRQQRRSEALIKRIRAIAHAKGFDLSVLLDVNQADCEARP